MAKLEENEDDKFLDPVVRAAMIPDPDDEPSDGKGAKKSEAEESEKSEKTEDNKSEEDAKKTEDKPKQSDDTKTEDKQEGDKGKENPNKEVPKPKAEDGKSTDEERQSRKERREERKQRFIEKIRREQPQTTSQKPEKSDKPDYKPLDYNESDQVDAKTLQEDRDKFGEVKLAEGREAERKLAEQEKFWSTLEHEATVLSFDPKYAFLNEKSPDFDADRAADINEMYLELVGFDATNKTVQRTDLSYDRFAKNYIDQMERYADERQAETVKNLATQASNAGIRPSGAASSGLKKLKPGDISRMTPEEVEKNEAEIDRQILAELGA
jgi:hypothetical protein